MWRERSCSVSVGPGSSSSKEAGFDPRLALSMPSLDEYWLSQFAKGLNQAAKDFSVQLVGGDTVKATLAITIQAFGIVENGKAITRNTAKLDDAIYISGEIGGAALAVSNFLERTKLPKDIVEIAENYFYYPKLPVLFAQNLSKFATAAIDLSDGFVQDVSHILHASKLGAELYIDNLPVCKEIKSFITQELLLAGGEDYQIIFTVSQDKEKTMLDMANKCNVKVSKIGHTTSDREIKAFWKDEVMQYPFKGWRHF